MLQIEQIDWTAPPKADESGEDLFRRNPRLTLTIIAPVYWWVDCGLEYLFFSPIKNKFCLDMWKENEKLIELVKTALIQESDWERQMQLMPMGVYARAEVPLSYRTLIELCENYAEDEYSDFLHREWKDLCETILDIHGVRDLVKEY